MGLGHADPRERPVRAHSSNEEASGGTTRRGHSHGHLTAMLGVHLPGPRYIPCLADDRLTPEHPPIVYEAGSSAVDGLRREHHWLLRSQNLGYDHRLGHLGSSPVDARW